MIACMDLGRGLGAFVTPPPDLGREEPASIGEELAVRAADAQFPICVVQMGLDGLAETPDAEATAAMDLVQDSLDDAAFGRRELLKS